MAKLRLRPGKRYKMIWGHEKEIRDVVYLGNLRKTRLDYRYSFAMRNKETGEAELWGFENYQAKWREGQDESEAVLTPDPMAVQDLRLTVEEKKSLENLLQQKGVLK